MIEIPIKYFSNDIPEIQSIDKGDWIDLRVNQIFISPNESKHIKEALKNKSVHTWKENNTIRYRSDDILIIRLGIAMQLPEGYEAEIKPRSSTFRDYGILLTNSVGCIDNSYCGDNDEWLAIYYATRNGAIQRFDRILQFRINKKMPHLAFKKVSRLNNKDRGGFGSTGIK